TNLCCLDISYIHCIALLLAQRSPGMSAGLPAATAPRLIGTTPPSSPADLRSISEKNDDAWSFRRCLQGLCVSSPERCPLANLPSTSLVGRPSSPAGRSSEVMPLTRLRSSTQFGAEAEFAREPGELLYHHRA